MVTASAARTHTAPGLKARCRGLREQLEKQGVATAEEIARYWPGGSVNRYTGYDGWIECYAQLVRLAGRLERQTQTASQADDKLEATVRAAAARQPIPVALSIGEYAVHQKSAYALAFLDSLEAASRPLAALHASLIDGSTEADQTLRAMPDLVAITAWRTWAWVLCTPGVALPFGDVGAIAPPAWTADLLAEDYLLIWTAHRRLHYEATAIMANAMASDGGPERSRLSLSGFLAGYGAEHGIAPSVLIRRWGFPEAVAAAVASYESHRVATANAEAERARKDVRR